IEGVNSSLSGTTSIELLEFSLPRLEVQSEDVFGIVVMTTGGNDVIHNYGRTPPREGAMYGATMPQAEPWFVNFEVRLQNILDSVEGKFPGGCEIFLGNIYDPTDGVGDTINAGLPPWKDGLKVLQRYNQIIEETSSQRKHVHLVDIHSTFLGHGIHCKKFWKKTYRSHDPYYWYFDNLEDPNDRGYDAIRRLYLNKIAEVVPHKL
ncbi:MAG: SGNH/GDSL hydrolase family protein, partial [Planctomicrobium sp.]|nr:SGNH/GDSL hydrolase family protein [Planctomicrobium sp.]